MPESMTGQAFSHLGSGWAYPLNVSVQGGVQTSAADRNIQEAIALILRTNLGERVYRPTFGSRLAELTFAPLNSQNLLLMRLYVQEAILLWEPRITLESVTAEPDPIRGRVDIQINYRLKETYEAGSMVYPFYLMSVEEEE